MLREEGLLDLQERVARVRVADKLADYMLSLAEATRHGGDFLLGVSTRGLQSLFRAAQALALCEGRGYAIPDDVQRLAGAGAGAPHGPQAGHGRPRPVEQGDRTGGGGDAGAPVKTPLLRPPRVPEGIRITTVGLWYVLFTVLVAIAATNTGNNALYMVLALMFSVLIVSGVASRENVRGLEADLEPPGEVFANRPFAVGFRLRSRALVFPRWFLLFTLSRSAQPLLIPYLPRRGKSVGQLEMMVGARGLPPLPLRPRLQPLPLRLLPQGRALPRGFRGAGLPRALPGGGQPPRGVASSRATTPAAAAAGGTTSTPCAPSAAATIRGASTGSRRRAPAS